MVLAIVGPTGIGKSEVAVELARATGGEIVASDSMQVYRGMDVGTGKPSAQIRREIPHHGIDLLEPEQEFHVARYCAKIRPVIERILSEGKLPIVVGGAGLYVKRLMGGLCPAPGAVPSLRQKLISEEKEKGAGWLMERLRRVDPEAAQRIHPRDQRKIIRALEVFMVSGKSLSTWHDETTAGSSWDWRVMGLTCERAFLYERIERRIDGWLAAGWLKEARVLAARPLSMTAQKALGYQELFRYLKGELTWEEAVALMKRNSRRYAKRQWTWFRADPRIQWFTVEGQGPGEIASLIMGRLFPAVQSHPA